MTSSALTPRRGFRRAIALAALGVMLGAIASATELTDLGQNLAYLRVHDLASVEKVVTSVVPENRALVLDLRYATAAGDSPARLTAALAARPGPAPLFILVAPGTPAPLAAALEKLPPNATTLGVPQAVPAPRLVVAQDPEADRRAHAAFDAGSPVAALITGKIEKERYDEASLVKDFANGNREPRPPPARPNAPAANPTPADPGEPAEPKAPAITDRVLQRAVHLHRALYAIRPRP
ncbi:MAG TPA: hypothetical protein VEB66_03170 [Opitutaceae bacterium]|nr:hypothetical protein [Opitutaceae bacterium]